MAILIWAIVGLITWAGATSFGEFGAAIPRNGSMQEYLKYIYGELSSFNQVVHMDCSGQASTDITGVDLILLCICTAKSYRLCL